MDVVCQRIGEPDDGTRAVGTCAVAADGLDRECEGRPGGCWGSAGTVLVGHGECTTG